MLQGRDGYVRTGCAFPTQLKRSNMCNHLPALKRASKIIFIPSPPHHLHELFSPTTLFACPFPTSSLLPKAAHSSSIHVIGRLCALPVRIIESGFTQIRLVVVSVSSYGLDRFGSSVAITVTGHDLDDMQGMHILHDRTLTYRHSFVF